MCVTAVYDGRPRVPRVRDIGHERVIEGTLASKDDFTCSYVRFQQWV